MHKTGVRTPIFKRSIQQCSIQSVYTYFFSYFMFWNYCTTNQTQKLFISSKIIYDGWVGFVLFFQMNFLLLYTGTKLCYNAFFLLFAYGKLFMFHFEA